MLYFVNNNKDMFFNFFKKSTKFCYVLYFNSLESVLSEKQYGSIVEFIHSKGLMSDKYGISYWDGSDKSRSLNIVPNLTQIHVLCFYNSKMDNDNEGEDFSVHFNGTHNYIYFQSDEDNMLVELYNEFKKTFEIVYGFTYKAFSNKYPSDYALGDGETIDVEVSKFVNMVKYNKLISTISSGEIIRDIYRENIIFKSHLKIILSSGDTLYEFINSNGNGELVEIQMDCYLWRINEKSLIRVRRELKEQSFIIANRIKQ